jgi:OOP family OmpA-OmpF porin
MNSIPKFLALMMAAALVGCERREESLKQLDVQPTPTAAVIEVTPAKTSDTSINGFDVDKAPVVNPELGKFPYVGLIEGHQPTARMPNHSRDAAFDRYEFFDGAKIIPVEGRLMTIQAEGRGSSAFEVFKTYESLIMGLGGVKVYEGKLLPFWNRKLEFTDARHRDPVFDDDQVGVYLLRTPEREIWLEAYIRPFNLKNGYFLTVVEKKALNVRASLLPAEAMKRELDTKGHVALYINFDFDKADIKPDSHPIIDQMVKLLKDNPGLRLTVEGHTDNAGAPDYNRKLSDARARSVVAALTSRGIEAGRLKAVGYGQDKPVADNSTDDGKAKNRRVELVKLQ